MMLLGGVSALVAGAPLYGMISDSPVARAIAGVVFQISGVFMVSGAAAMCLSRAGGPTLPSERLTTSAADRPDVGGLLIGLAIVLVALPLWLLLLLQPFLAEWSVVARLLAASELWQGANANMSGVILVPLAGALTPPLFELAALFAFVVASAVLLALLLSRSRRFPRIYVVCGVLLSALVIASVRGADAAMMAGDAVRQLIEASSPSAEESAQLMNGLARYTSIVGSTAPVLAWALCAYLAWMPAMFFSQRVRTTFAASADDRVSAPTPSTAIGLATITRPPRFPG
jgi:hypothetical protein